MAEEIYKAPQAVEAQPVRKNTDGKKPMKTFIFDIRWHEAIRDLPRYDQIEMYEAICEYARTGEAPTPDSFTDPCKRMALRMIFDQIDCERRVCSIVETEN